MTGKKAFKTGYNNMSLGALEKNRGEKEKHTGIQTKRQPCKATDKETSVKEQKLAKPTKQHNCKYHKQNSRVIIQTNITFEPVAMKMTNEDYSSIAQLHTEI